jgi:hypothetical protein
MGIILDVQELICALTLQLMELLPTLNLLNFLSKIVLSSLLAFSEAFHMSIQHNQACSSSSRERF